VFALFPCTKETIALVLRAACSNYTARSAVDIFHALRLGVEVTIVTLDDANAVVQLVSREAFWWVSERHSRVNPQVSDSESPSTYHSVSKCPW
jgi:hypothetical protein